MSFNFSGHEDDQGANSPHSADFGFEWLNEPTFRDVLDECSARTSSYDQVTFASEAGALSRDFGSDVVLAASVRDGQVYDPPNKDIPVMTSSPRRLLLHNPVSELVESDLIKFQMRYDIPDLIWLRLPLSGKRVD